MKKISSILGLAAVLFLALTVQAASGRVFVLANDASPDTITNLMTVKLADLLKEKSNGAFATDIYPSAKMGSDVLLTQSCQAGDVTFVLQTTAPQASLVRAAYVFDIPNLYRDVSVARTVLDRFLPVIAPYYERAGFKLLGFADQHFRVMTANRRITSIGDFQNLRIRTMQNKYHAAYWGSLGAVPAPLPYPDLAFSLDRGYVEAQENPIEVVVGGGFYKQQKYVVETNHLLHSISIIMSKSVYDGLTPEERKIVEEAARETVVWGREQADARETTRLETLKAYGTELLPVNDELRGELVRRSHGLRDDIRREVGNDLTDAFLKEIEIADKARQ